ncbi:hypothetical protein COOONC_18405 [Cooperia oncophora]
MMAKTKSRSKRMEQARQKRLTEEQGFTTTADTRLSGANGVPLTGNGAVHRRRTSGSVAEVAAAISPRANGIRPLPHEVPHEVDIEAQVEAPQSKHSSLSSTSLRRSSVSSAPDRPGSSSKSSRTTPPQRAESVDYGRSSQMSRSSTINPGSEPRDRENRPVTSSAIAMTVTPLRPNPIGKFVRSPLARTLTPPDDISMDSEEDNRSVGPSVGLPSRNNKVAPE